MAEVRPHCSQEDRLLAEKLHFQAIVAWFVERAGGRVDIPVLDLVRLNGVTVYTVMEESFKSQVMRVMTEKKNLVVSGEVADERPVRVVRVAPEREPGSGSQ